MVLFQGDSLPDINMTLLRTFIAVEIPREIQSAIYQSTVNLRQTINRSYIRWVPPQNIHITLKFLGDVSPANLELLKQMLKAETAQVDHFSIQVGTLGVFPGLRYPRVIWIGIDAPPALESLQRGIETATTRLGYEAENRPFSPHLTIARFNLRISTAELPQVRAILEKTSVGILGKVDVDAVHLFKSDLKPSGVIYSRLYTAPLRAFSNDRGDV
jgi:2'-5' RNA ligase